MMAMSAWGSALQRLSPDAALVLFTVGVLLIYVEFNRPGSILPAAAGILLTLLAVAPLLRSRPDGAALLLVAASVLLLAVDLQIPTHFLVSTAATICLVLGFLKLIADPGVPRIHAAFAVPCGVILGVITSILTRIARRARVNKGLDLERARTSRPGVFKS